MFNKESSVDLTQLNLNIGCIEISDKKDGNYKNCGLNLNIGCIEILSIFCIANA